MRIDVWVSLASARRRAHWERDIWNRLVGYINPMVHLTGDPSSRRDFVSVCLPHMCLYRRKECVMVWLQEIHSYRLHDLSGFTLECKINCCLFSKWSVVGKRNGPTEESHFHLPDAGQVWPRPHGGGARRATLWDHAVFRSHPAQGHDRGRRRYASRVSWVFCVWKLFFINIWWKISCKFISK